MGNCIVLCHQHAEKSRVIFYNGKEKEFKASTQIKKITSGRYTFCKIVHHAFPFSPLPPDTMLEAGELYYLMPPLLEPCSLNFFPKLADHETCAKQKIKIVLTKQQLEILLGNAMESKGIVRFSGSFRKGDPKWQPSLASIQEVQKF